MNCTQCGKDVNDHGESRETDRCVAEKLGWKFVQNAQEETGEDYFCRIENYDNRVRDGGWQLAPDSDLVHGWACAKCQNELPKFSSPEMTKEIWELVEKMKEYFDYIAPQSTGWMLVLINKDNNNVYFYDSNISLLIIRAYLCQEEG